MKRNIMPEVRLHVEGDNGRILDALREAKLQAYYDEWLETRMLVFDDDPDGPTVGHFTIRSLPVLWALMRALWWTTTPPAQMKDCYLWLEGGDMKIGYSVSLHNTETKGEWRGDEKTLTNEFGKAFHEIKAIIHDLDGLSL